MPTKVFVDAEAAAKAWALAEPNIAALAGPRVFLAFNETAASKTQLVVGRAGGAPDFGEAPLDLAVVSFSCWAATRKAAADLAYTVVSAAESIDGPTPAGGAVIHGARVLLAPLPASSQADELAKRHRFITDVQFVIRTAS